MVCRVAINCGNYLSLRDISIGVVRSEAFMILFPAARLGLAISVSSEVAGLLLFLAYRNKTTKTALLIYIVAKIQFGQIP